MKNFLVMNTSFFGDTLLSGPLCQALKAAYPESYLYFVANAPFADAARYMQGVDAVLPYDKKKQHKGIGGAWRFYKAIREKLPPIDAAFVIYGNERNIILAKLLGAAEIYSDNNGLIRGLLTNGKISYGQLTHVQDKNLFLSTLYTKAAFEALPMRYIPPVTAMEKAAVLLREQGIIPTAGLTAVCTTSKRAEKDMPVLECGRLINLLRESGRIPLLVGAGEVAEQYRDVLRKQVGTAFVDFTGRTSIPVLAAVLQKCTGLISVDTGTLHLGLSVGVPTVAVYYLNEPAHLAAWAPKKLYTHILMTEPEISAAAMLAQLQKIERNRLHE